MNRTIAVLGSTGSIGTQTLEIAAALHIRVAGLSAGRNASLLASQIARFHPRVVSVADASVASALRSALDALPAGRYREPLEILYGDEGNRTVATLPESNLVVAAMVGIAGLGPVLSAIQANKDIALANKETLVAGGSIVMPLIREHKVRLLPVDSEHSAIWQCLWGNDGKKLRRILLTASGGPFRQTPVEALELVDVKAALSHPTWRMGGKITIDSATMMNKGLEVIEASWLFDVPVDQIQVVVHPQSIIHSMVEYVDHSVIAQLGFPDMRLPIHIALTWPDRTEGICDAFDPFDPRACALTFEPPDTVRFPCLQLAYEAARTGGSMPCVLNSANEEAVAGFLAGHIGFTEIARKVESCMERHARDGIVRNPGFDDIMELDHWARSCVRAFGR